MFIFLAKVRIREVATLSADKTLGRGEKRVKNEEMSSKCNNMLIIRDIVFLNFHLPGELLSPARIVDGNHTV